MKKIMIDKSFWIIFVCSIITLIGLTIGVIFLTRQNSKEFYSAGYIINSTATKSDKFYFEENTVYKENVFNEYVFKDVDDKEVSTSKDNFIHYLDNSLSFMKNGVIMDLDNFNENIVPYYNITDKSIVKYNNGSYYVETADKTLYFGNFLGRITENKYIVAGTDISVKLSGNDTPVKGNYFEILFVEDGIVKIENQEGSYQTISDGTMIYIGDNIKINLGDKTLNYGDETKLNLSELTIDGNENIDIVPEGVVDKDDNSGGSGGSGNGDGTGTGIGDGDGTGTGEGEGTGEGNGTGGGTGDGDGEGEGTGTGTGTGTGEGTGEGDGTGEGTGSGGGGGSGDASGDGSGTGEGDGTGEGEGTGTGEDIDGETNTVLRKEVSVNLIEASSDVNSIFTKFQVIDTMEAIKGNLNIELLNVTTGEPVKLEEGDKILYNHYEEQDILIEKLKSNSNYLMTITDGVGVQYFQKSFRTSNLDLVLKRELVTEDRLEYSLDFANQSEVISADISLQDENGVEMEGYRSTIINGSNKPAIFNNLTPNTVYTVVVDKVNIKNMNEPDYKTEVKVQTLKNKPTLGNISVRTNDSAKTFTLYMDPDTIKEKDSIVSYKYEIFECKKGEDGVEKCTDVYDFTRTREQFEKSGGTEILKIDPEKGLYSNTDYKFRVVAQYYDNYRLGVVKTGLSEDFNVDGMPTISFEKDEVAINKISGTVFIEDENCLVAFEGRECNPGSSNYVIEYTDGFTQQKYQIDRNDIDIDADNMSLYFEVNGLKQDTPYIFSVYADVKLSNKEDDEVEKKHIGSFMVRTEGIDGLVIQKWTPGEYKYENPISATAELKSSSDDSDSINNLRYLTVKLYNGNATKRDENGSNIENSNAISEGATPIASYTIKNIKVEGSMYLIDINSNMFKYTDETTGEEHSIDNLDVLKMLSGGNLSDQYTIEITDAKDDGTNYFEIENRIYVYQTPVMLLLEEYVETNMIVVPIENKHTASDEKEKLGFDFDWEYDSDLDPDTVRGYCIEAGFNESHIYDRVNSYTAISTINFYAHDINGKLIEKKEVNFNEVKNKKACFYLENGTDSDVDDSAAKVLARGNSYVFSFDLSIDHDRDVNTPDELFPADKNTEKVDAKKQTPVFKYYINNSTDTSVTYKYKVYDIDNALSKEEGKYFIHYNVGDEEYTTEYFKDGSSDEFTLSNLSNGVIYKLGYYSERVKKLGFDSNFKNYYFDGYYNLNNSLKYKLDFGENSNNLKIILEDDELLNRISAYLLTLSAEGVDNKYTKVISDLDVCVDEEGNEEKCIIVSYRDINTKEFPFMGKNIAISLEAFYDNGYVGFGQTSILGQYFKNFGYVDDENASKVGFVYQNIGNDAPGKYVNIRNGSFVATSTQITQYDYPRGILGFELISNDNYKSTSWKLNSVNLIDDRKQVFVPFGEISYVNLSVGVNTQYGSIKGVPALNDKIKDLPTINPKVLDKASVDNNEGNSFKFTRIIPEVKTKIKRLINGAIIDVDVININEEILKNEYYATDGKYNFYIDISREAVCPDAPVVEEDNTEETQVLSDCVPGEIYKEFVKRVPTDYYSLDSVYIDGLDPASKYSYTIFADMNKNGVIEEVNLFEENGNDLEKFEESFTTLNEKDIFSNVYYDFTSKSTSENYSNRFVNFKTYLKNKVNMNIKYELTNEEGEVFSVIVSNDQIVEENNNIIASYTHDVTGREFVFGPGYHELVITAITTDLEKELELYRGMLEYDTHNHFFTTLDLPTFSISNDAILDVMDNSSTKYKHSIFSTITVTDKDKVINDGIFYVELQDPDGNNICAGHEDDCRVKIDINKGTCQFSDNTIVSKWNIEDQNAYMIRVSFVFDNLKENTEYSVYTYADTYRNNNNLTQKDKIDGNRLNQYTKNEYNFSLGSVVATAVSNDKLVMSFENSSNLNDSLVGMKYNVYVQSSSKDGDKVESNLVASGYFGKYLDIDNNVIDSGNNLVFDKNSNGYPIVNIPITDGKLKESNYINISYYYKDVNDNNKIKLLELGGLTVHKYNFSG